MVDQITQELMEEVEEEENIETESLYPLPVSSHDVK